jgi:hypothetical protein
MIISARAPTCREDAMAVETIVIIHLVGLLIVIAMAAAGF